MSLDAIIIAEAGDVGSTDIIHQRLRLDGKVATIQVISNYLKHKGRVVPPVEGSGVMNWGAAYRLNGIYLLSYLLKGGLRVKLIDRYFKDRASFREMLRENPRAVIISTTFIRNKQTLKRVVEDIRDLAPDIFIIARGGHLCICPTVCWNDPARGTMKRILPKRSCFLKTNNPGLIFTLSAFRARISCWRLYSGSGAIIRWTIYPTPPALMEKDILFQSEKTIFSIT